MTDLNAAAAAIERVCDERGIPVPPPLARDLAEAAAPHIAEPYEVTLATVRQVAERATAVPAGTGHARGYYRAMQHVLAVLAAHGSPPDTPVMLGEGTTP